MRNYKFRVKDIKKIDKELCKFMKACKDCGELKLMIKFGKEKSKKLKDGHRNQCKQCRSNQKKKYNCICEYCGKEFIGYKDQRFHKECKHKWHSENIKGENNPMYKKEGLRGENSPKYNSVFIPCDCCGKLIQVQECQLERSEHHFCNMKCYAKWKSRNLLGENNPRYTSILSYCDYCGKLIPIKHYALERSEHHFCNRECHYKWKSENIRGEIHPNYNPNLTQEEREQGRNIEGYEEWRKRVYERDNYACQITGDNKGGNLVAHHLYSYSDCPELRTSVDNGITLTEETHKLFHKIYGYKHNTKEQFEEFKERYNNGEFKEVI